MEVKTSLIIIFYPFILIYYLDQLGWSCLYTGCRHKSKDWFYGEELNHFVNENILSKYYVAFSRDEMEINQRKTYVQHLMKENSKEIWDEILSKGGYIFLSG